MGDTVTKQNSQNNNNNKRALYGSLALLLHLIKQEGIKKKQPLLSFQSLCTANPCRAKPKFPALPGLHTGQKANSPLANSPLAIKSSRTGPVFQPFTSEHSKIGQTEQLSRYREGHHWCTQVGKTDSLSQTTHSLVSDLLSAQSSYRE